RGRAARGGGAGSPGPNGGPGADQLHAAATAGIFPLDLPAQQRGPRRRARDPPLRQRGQGAAPRRAGVRGGRMSGFRFGPELSQQGVTFRLWAPAARSVELIIDGPRRMQPQADGWHTLAVADAGKGTRYRFRIDGELEVPDPASPFQPDDVDGPSEVIDHDWYAWRTPDWRGRPWEDA